MTDTAHTQWSSDARFEAIGLECIRDDRVLFSDLSFTIESGTVLQLEGRNGSGKTSLLKILCGLRMPDEGELRWTGREGEAHDELYYEQIAYVGHHSGVKRDLTPLENLRVARALGTPSHAMDLEDALEKVELYGFEDVPVYTLSAGQQRRTALARLLVTEARLWVLDEPYTALDTRGIGILEDLMQQHTQRGGMIALTTHHTVDLNDTPVTCINLSERRETQA